MAAGRRLIRLDKELEGKEREGDRLNKVRRERGGQGQFGARMHERTIREHTHTHMHGRQGWDACPVLHTWIYCTSNQCVPAGK